MQFAVTGATGWLGRATLEHLERLLGPDLLVAEVGAFASRPTTILLDSGTRVAVRPLEELVTTPHERLIHLAFVTRERLADMGLEAYLSANLRITAAVTAAIRRQRPRGVFYSSSGAVHATLATDVPEVTSDPYGVLKVLDELAVRRIAGDVGAACAVGRIFNMAGPWLTKPEVFALGDLIWQGVGNGRIIVRAQGPVRRSFIDVEDVAALAVLLASEAAESDIVMDLAGDRPIEIGELALRVADALALAPDAVERVDPTGPPDDYVGDGEAVKVYAARRGLRLRPLDEQLTRSVAYLSSRRQ